MNGLGGFLKGLIEAIGRGSLQNFNTATLGPDFKERRAESASRLETAGQNRQVTQAQLDEIARTLGAEGIKAGGEFPGMDLEGAVRSSRAKMLGTKEQRETESHETDIGYKKAQASELGERYHKNAALEEERIRSGIDDKKERNIDRDLMRALIAANMNRDNDRADRGTPPKGLTRSEYLAARKLAEERADVTTKNDNPTEAEVAAALQAIMAGYEATQSSGAPSATPAGPATAAGAGTAPETRVFTTGPCAGKTATRTPRGTWDC